jgi:hypothetical protein
MFLQFLLQIVPDRLKIHMPCHGQGELVAILIFIGAHPGDYPFPKLVRLGMSPRMTVIAKADNVSGVKCGGHSVPLIEMMGCRRKVTTPRGAAEDIPSADNSLHEGITLPF